MYLAFLLIVTIPFLAILSKLGFCLYSFLNLLVASSKFYCNVTLLNLLFSCSNDGPYLKLAMLSLFFDFGNFFCV